MHIAMPRRRFFHTHAVRNVDAGVFLERFLVAAISTLLLLRFYLEATGFPQVGGNGLHVAHVLWGGLLMCAAIVLVLTALGKQAQNLAALAGGAGFGLFIDEVGKFLTSDNNYFFKPAIAIIYVVFMLLFLVLRAVGSGKPLSDEANLINAVDEIKEALLTDMDESRKARALLLLQRSDQHNPIVQTLMAMLNDTVAEPDPNPNWLHRTTRWARATYLRIIRSGRLARVLVFFFCIYALGTTLTLAGFAISAHDLAGEHLNLSVAGIGDAATSLISDLFVVYGVVALIRSRHRPLRAYIWFRRAVLVSLFLGQFFSFYLDQLWALADLSLDIVLFGTLEYMISQERTREFQANVAQLGGDAPPALSTATQLHIQAAAASIIQPVATEHS